MVPIRISCSHCSEWFCLKKKEVESIGAGLATTTCSHCGAQVFFEEGFEDLEEDEEVLEIYIDDSEEQSFWTRISIVPKKAIERLFEIHAGHKHK